MSTYRTLTDRALADLWQARITTPDFDLNAFALETARRAAASERAYR